MVDSWSMRNTQICIVPMYLKPSATVMSPVKEQGVNRRVSGIGHTNQVSTHSSCLPDPSEFRLELRAKKGIEVPNERRYTSENLETLELKVFGEFLPLLQ